MRFKLLAKIRYFVMPMSVSVCFCPFLARFGVIWHDKGSSHSIENYRLPFHCSSLAVSLPIACPFDAYRLQLRCPTKSLCVFALFFVGAPEPPHLYRMSPYIKGD